MSIGRTPHPMSDPPIAAVDRADRPGSPGLAAVHAVGLAAAAASYSLLPQDQAGRLTLGLLSILAFTGLIALFFFAVGFLQLSGHGARNDLTKLIADTGPEGLLVTEGDSHILYANEAYLSLAGSRDGSSLRGVERLFSGSPDVSEAIYRLAQASREQKRGAEELRMAPSLTGDSAVGWYRVRVRPIAWASAKRATLWTVADVTRERERHENVFQELQHAIDFLDHAPAGFFSADPDGRISYMNATLTAWLDYDLAEVGSGGLYLPDVIAGDGASMLLALSGGAGDVKTAQFDIDMKRRMGRACPCDSSTASPFHRIAYPVRLERW